MEKRFGKIQTAKFGYNGYQESMMGFYLDFSGPGWGVSFFDGFWGHAIERTEHTKWTEEQRNAKFAEVVTLVDNTLKAAKVRYVNELENIPVEVTFEGNTLKSWRILEEVL